MSEFPIMGVISAGAAGLLCIALAIIAVVVFKKKNKEVWALSALIGAASFFVFVVLLEPLLHAVMIPFVKDNAVLYMIYGGFAAGLFEETGRFLAYKLLMRKHYSVKNAVMMGLGHGGFEAAYIGAMAFLAYMGMTIAAYTVGGVEEFARISGMTDPAAVEQLGGIVGGVAAMTPLTAALSLYERIIAIAIQTSLSVVVYFGASKKGFWWLYPAAILLHAVFDFPAALFQKQVITEQWIVELICTAEVGLMVFGTVMLAKYFKKREGESVKEAVE